MAHSFQLQAIGDAKVDKFECTCCYKKPKPSESGTSSQNGNGPIWTVVDRPVCLDENKNPVKCRRGVKRSINICKQGDQPTDQMYDKCCYSKFKGKHSCEHLKKLYPPTNGAQHEQCRLGNIFNITLERIGHFIGHFWSGYIRMLGHLQLSAH